MLANGATIGYKATGGSGTTYTDIPGLKSLPDLGVEPELVENTALGDSNKQYEIGIGDPGNMEFVFRYDNSGSSASYRVASGISGKNDFKVALSDGTSVTFTGTPKVRISGGGVNDPVEFVMAIAVQSAITVTNPA